MSKAIQPMPELTADELDALRNDIAANGVLVPVVKDQHGRILDGNHRAAIATELGIDFPVRVVEVADDAEAWDRAVALNCARRHLNREQVRELIGNEIRRKPDESDRAIARRVGCSPTTVGTVRAEWRAEAEELTRQIRADIVRIRGQIAMLALQTHRNGSNWQTVGDVLERTIRHEVSKLDSDYCERIWGPIYGSFFDAVRATDCEPDCMVCTPHDRQWRDEHPQQVYRWTDLSNLDTEAVR